MPDPSRRGVALLLEGLVVLVSILAAFFLEGWRADRELERELGQELASVRAELERNRDLIAVELAALDRVTTAGAALAAALRVEAGSTVSVPDTLVFLGAQWHPSFSPSLGALNALIGSGRLAQVAETDLRLGLAGLEDAVNDALEEELFSRQVSVEQLLPLIGEEADLTPVSEIAVHYLNLGGPEGLNLQEQSLGRPVPGAGPMLIPNTPSVRNALIRRNMWLGAAIMEFSQLDAHIEDLIAIISSEAGN